MQGLQEKEYVDFNKWRTHNFYLEQCNIIHISIILKLTHNLMEPNKMETGLF